MFGRADNAGAQVEVDDPHKVRAILRTSDYSGAQAELEAALRDVDESLLAGRLLGAAVTCALRFATLRRATRPFPVMGKATGRKSTTRAALVDIPARRASEGTGGVTRGPRPASRACASGECGQAPQSRYRCDRSEPINPWVSVHPPVA